MSNIFVNSFVNGVISPFARRFVTSSIYNNSASVMENVLPLNTGGFRLRNGMEKVSVKEDAKRILPLFLGDNGSYLVILETRKLTLMDLNDPLYEWSSATIYTEETISKLNYTQDYEKMILVCEDCVPYILKKELTGFTFKPIELDKRCNYKNEEGEAIEFDYKGLFTTEGNYPSIAAFCSNRLWFASSKSSPYKLWASRPFEYANFQDIDFYEEIDETGTAEEYLDAIVEKVTTTYWLSYYDGELSNQVTDNPSINNSNYKLEQSDSKDPTTGYITTLKKIFKKTKLGEHEQTEHATHYWKFLETKQSMTESETKIKYKYNSTITASCAMVFEVGSDTLDTIKWISVSDNIYIGTATSEYYIPKEITPLSPFIAKVSSNGSNGKIAQGKNLVFYVQDKNIRALNYNQNQGISDSSINALCQHLFQSGIKELQWQRIDTPYLYALLNNGEMAVFCLEEGINSWTSLKTNGEIKSIAVIEKDVFFIVKRESGTFIEKFTEGVYVDNGNYKINAKVVSNFVDDANTIAMKKSVSEFFVDSYGTPFKIGTKGATLEQKKEYNKNSELAKVTAFTKVSDSFSWEIENIEFENFIILALVLKMEVS